MAEQSIKVFPVLGFQKMLASPKNTNAMGGGVVLVPNPWALGKCAAGLSLLLVKVSDGAQVVRAPDGSKEFSKEF
jgi:hypothetical protein